MADNQQKDLFTQAELDTFSKWAAAQESAGVKITFRAVKAFMKCGVTKADALRRQYQDNKTRGAIEEAQTADVPENVLNAFSEYIQGQIAKVAAKMREQIKEAENRAAEVAESLETAELAAENARKEAEDMKASSIALKAKLDVLLQEQAENKARLEAMSQELQAAKIEAARAQGALDALKSK